MQHFVQYAVLSSVMADAASREQRADSDTRRRPDEALTGCRNGDIERNVL